MRAARLVRAPAALSTTRGVDEQPATVWARVFAHAATVRALYKQLGGCKGDAMGHGIQAVAGPTPGETLRFGNKDAKRHRYSAGLVAGATTSIGGVVLLALSFCFEPKAVEALNGDWGLAAWGGWLFLVFFGSLVGYSVYMRLLRDIGASRAGTYSFVSPVIAVLLGVVILGETVSIVDVIGMTIMLSAAWLAMDIRPEQGPLMEQTEGAARKMGTRSSGGDGAKPAA